MSKSFELSRTAKGILIALILSVAFNLILSLIYYFTSIQESLIHSLITSGLSVLAASFYIAFQSGSKGLFYGLSIGLGFFLLSLIVHFIFYAGNPSWLLLLEKSMVSLASGALGGTIGAVLKR